MIQNLLFQQEAAGIGHLVGSIVVGQTVILADLQHQHSVCLHGRNHLLREAAGSVRIGALFAGGAGTGAFAKEVIDIYIRKLQ